MSRSASTAVRSRGPYRTGLRRREQIIDAATAVFAEYGYAGGSVRTIADRVGVSPASLLQHFGSKEGLLMAVLEDWDRRTVEARLTDVTGLDYFRRLPEVMGAHLANRGLLELFSTIAAEASSPAHPAREFIQRRYTDNLATLATHLRRSRRGRRDRRPHPGRDRPGGASGDRGARRDRTAMAARPLHRRRRHRRHLHQPQHHPLAQRPMSPVAGEH